MTVCFTPGCFTFRSGITVAFVQLAGELSDARARARQLSRCVDRRELPGVRGAEIHPNLSVRQVGRLGRRLRFFRRGDDDDRRRDPESERDRRERRAGPGLMANEVSQRQPRRDGDPSGDAGEDADREWAEQQAADDRRHDPRDDEELSLPVGERETADADRDQRRCRDRGVARGPRSRWAARERMNDRKAGCRPSRPPGGRGCAEDGEEGRRRDQPPGKAEPVDAMVDCRLERRRRTRTTPQARRPSRRGRRSPRRSLRSPAARVAVASRWHRPRRACRDGVADVVRRLRSPPRRRGTQGAGRRWSRRTSRARARSGCPSRRSVPP